MNSIKKYKHISFNKENKSFTILKGSMGTYPYTNIKKVTILYEDATFTGKTDMFTHTVLVGIFQPPTMIPRNVFTGVNITMVDGTKLYVYISEEKTQVNSLQFYEDTKNAEEIKAYINKIIDKYQDK